MDLEGKTSAAAIVMDAGMSARPGFYSGRGATTTDLNDKILEKVYQSVKKAHGDNGAKNFVQMVADIPKLSATDFLLTLYRLESQGWNWKKELAYGRENGIWPDSEGAAWGTIISGLSGMHSHDATNSIRNNFLRRHGIEVKDRPTKNDSINKYL